MSVIVKVLKNSTHVISFIKIKKAEPFDAYLEFGYRQVATVTTSKNSPRLTT